MKILTNNYSLRYSKDYLRNIDIDFEYINTGVFALCEHSPDFIISNNYHEIQAASKKYPSIVFISDNLKFPNIAYSVPQALLDEISIMSQHNLKCQPCDIAYFNNGGRDNIPFIQQLQQLGNTKIMGPGYCNDELDKSFPQRLTPAFYKKAKVVAVSSKEEALKGLFMSMPVISSMVIPYTYQNVSSIQLSARANQVEYAWGLSHTNVWSEILSLIGQEELSAKLKSIFTIKGNKDEARAN